MHSTASTYIREPKQPMNAAEFLEGLSTEERQLVTRLIQILKAKGKRQGSTRTTSRKTATLHILGDLTENFLPLFLDGDPTLPEKLNAWFKKYFDKPEPNVSKDKTPVWNEFLSKLRAARLRRAKRLENFLKSEQVMDGSANP